MSVSTGKLCADNELQCPGPSRVHDRYGAVGVVGDLGAHRA
jgi:hypothetical protein